MTLFMILAVTTFDYLSKGDAFGRFALLPRQVAYVAEILGAVAAAYVLLMGARSGFRFVRPAYVFVFAALIVTILCGILANQVAPGVVFAGIRSYLRAVPWFLVPAVYAFSEGQVRTQLRLLLAIAILQSPLALEQTLNTMGRGFAFTGDFTTGTLLLSPTLSIFLVASACVAVAWVLRKRLTIAQFGVLFLLLLLPTTINETKVTVVLLPIGILLTMFVASEAQQRMRYFLVVVIMTAVFASAFVPIYNYLIQTREYDAPIGEILSDADRLERYLWSKKDVGVRGDVGRVDTIIVSLRVVSRDPVYAAFGHGLGNASESALGAGFSGKYAVIYGPFVTTTFGRLVTELGLVGLTLVVCVFLLIMRDAWVVARSGRDLIGALAAAWVAVTALMLILVPYTELIGVTSVSFLFWYLSGLVAAARTRGSMPLREPVQMHVATVVREGPGRAAAEQAP